MILFPHCKINLGLLVFGKRDDGYHELETLMYPVPIFDMLEIIPASDFSFSISGLTIPGSSNDNLCVKAYELLRGLKGIPPVAIHLHKMIPMGGGLGGGSADATFTLLGLNQLFCLNYTVSELQYLASLLGSDCPFFVNNSPQIASGRGEVLTTASHCLNGYWILLINIGIHISTKEAFQNVPISLEGTKGIQFLVNGQIDFDFTILNSFEFPAFLNYPELSGVKKWMLDQGALHAGMTGSGSTMFGIFKEEPPTYFSSKMNGEFQVSVQIV